MISYKTAILEYDRSHYPFAVLVKDHFKQKFGTCLHELHKAIPEGEEIARLEVGKDQQTEFHKHFYTVGPDFHGLYRDFVQNAILDGSTAYLYQRVPTFRVHLPGNVATGGFHRDADYNHNESELNFIVPLTQMRQSGSVWIESMEDAHDYMPYDMGVRQFLRFHGAKLTHGSYPNETGLTRVSFDFRILPKWAYKDDGKATINRGVAFRVGEYWAEVE